MVSIRVCPARRLAHPAHLRTSLYLVTPGNPSSATTAANNVLALMKEWNVPSFAAEFGSCDAWRAAAAANLSHSYWHYSSYCTTGPSFGNRSAPDDTFGACILGWAGADSSKVCR